MNSAKALAALALAIFSTAAAEAASFPPEFRFRSIHGPHVSVHFPQGLEQPARRALALAEELLAAHQARYGTRIRRVQVVLADVDDDPNGFATPLPYPMVQLRLVAPPGDDDLGNYEDWQRVLLTHELAHVVHLEQARGWWGFLRRTLGRAPFLFPNAVTPMWMVEGLATYEETQGTAFGRGRDPDSRMVVRMEALAHGLPAEDEPVLGRDRWPGGQAGYLFGQAFLRDVEERFGSQALPALARSNAGRPLPYLDQVTFKKVTGRGLHARWNEWRASFGEELRAEAARIAARGLTESRPLTRRGIRQVGARFSPDGQWIAYTSGTLTRLREVRVMRADGSGDRRLCWRTAGSDLSWTPDGRSIVFDDAERHHLYRAFFDLRVCDVASGRARWLTRGVRARDPNVSRDGRQVVFVVQKGDRSELAVIGMDGRGLREITRSEPWAQWSGPAFAPAGDWVAASRWSAGGWLDIVRVDPRDGSLAPLTHDRAKDVEPVVSPDGTHVLFRSDRDGVSNVYALRLADGALLRVTNVLGGAFLPDVDAAGRLLFSDYGAGGFDVRLARIDLAALPPADPFVDPYPEPRPQIAPADVPDRPYRPWPVMRPRFWAPYFDVGGAGTTFGVATGGADPLLRHAWLANLSWDTESRKVSGRGYYQYDRFRPTFLLMADESNDRALLADGPADVRDRELVLQASLPLARGLLSSHSLSLAWRRERQTVLRHSDPPLDFGGLEAAWTFSSTKQYAYSVSPVDGARVRVAALKEDPALGSSVSLAKVMADARVFVRALGETNALALRLGGGTTLGRPTFRQSFAVGGFPDAALVDVVRTNQTVLRGYPRNAFTGRRFVHGNLEYRFALAHPQRGWRSLPLFVRHVHATLLADAAHAWSNAFALRDVKTSVGAALGADVFLGNGLPVTGMLGLARGLNTQGETQLYFRTGLSF